MADHEAPEDHASGDDVREYASPACYRHLFDDAALIERLNTLIEGERAGARGVLEMRRGLLEMRRGLPAAQAGDSPPELPPLLDQVARDEARFCAMLSRHVTRLGGVPSRAVGVFYDKLLARDSLPARIDLLDRGQSAVVRVLDELLEQPIDAPLRRDLTEMRDVHVVNIERCARFAD